MHRSWKDRWKGRIAEDYAKRGWDTSIAVLLFYKLEHKIDARIRFLDFTGGIKSGIAKVPYWIQTVREYIKNEKPDIMVSFFSPVNIIVLSAAKRTGIPVIVSERNDPRHDGRGKIVQFLTDRLYPKAKKVIFQTKRAMECFSEKVQKDSCIVPNPVPVTCFASDKKVPK